MTDVDSSTNFNYNLTIKIPVIYPILTVFYHISD